MEMCYSGKHLKISQIPEITPAAYYWVSKRSCGTGPAVCNEQAPGNTAGENFRAADFLTPVCLFSVVIIANGKCSVAYY